MNFNQPFPITKFNESIRLNPLWSSLICFHDTIARRKNISPAIIRKNFNLLVDKDDYLRMDKNAVLEYALDLASGAEK